MTERLNAAEWIRRGYVSVTVGRTITVEDSESVTVSVTLGEECEAHARQEVFDSLLVAAHGHLRVAVGESVPPYHAEATAARQAAYQTARERAREVERERREASAREREAKRREAEEWERVWILWDDAMDGWETKARAARETFAEEVLASVGEDTPRGEVVKVVGERFEAWLNEHPKPAVPLPFPDWEVSSVGERRMERRREAWKAAQGEDAPRETRAVTAGEDMVRAGAEPKGDTSGTEDLPF